MTRADWVTLAAIMATGTALVAAVVYALLLGTVGVLTGK